MTRKLEPIDVAVAMSLYAYNVSGGQRAAALAEATGEDYEYLLGKLVRGINTNHWSDSPFIATELPAKVVVAYISQALAKYGQEARERNRLNLDPRPLDEILADTRTVQQILEEEDRDA